MKRITLLFLCIATIICASALDLKKLPNPFKKGVVEPFNYTAWADTTPLAPEIKGIRVVYPQLIDSTAKIIGNLQLPGLARDVIYRSILDFAIDNFDRDNEREGFAQLPSKYSAPISFYLNSKQGSNNTETTYNRLITLTPQDGEIIYEITDMDVRYREKGILPKTVSFENLNPAINKRHRELLDEFLFIQFNYFNNLVSHIKESPASDTISHWQEISKKQVVPGMSPLEVKLILGAPVTTREMSENRQRWVYPDNYIVLFKDGYVNRVMDR